MEAGLGLGGGGFQERPGVHLFGHSMAESTHDHTNEHFISIQFLPTPTVHSMTSKSPLL